MIIFSFNKKSKFRLNFRNIIIYLDINMFFLGRPCANIPFSEKKSPIIGKLKFPIITINTQNSSLQAMFCVYSITKCHNLL